jgi:hypothetical protein
LAPGALPPGVESVVLKAMQKDPAERFQSMREMMQALSDATEAAVLRDDNDASSAAPTRPGLSPWQGVAVGLVVGLIVLGVTMALLQR